MERTDDLPQTETAALLRKENTPCRRSHDVSHDASHDVSNSGSWRLENWKNRSCWKTRARTCRGKTTQWPPWKTRSWNLTLWSTKKKPEGWNNASSCKKFLKVFDFVIGAFFFKDLLWYIKDHQISIGYWSAPCNMFLIFCCCCWKPCLKPLPETNPFSHLKVGGWNTIVSSWDGGPFSGANLLWVLGSVTSSADWIWWSISWTNPSLRSVRNWMNSSSQDSMIEFLSVQFLSLQVHHTWILDLNNMIVLNRWICPRSFSYPIKYKFWLKLHFLSTNFAHLQPTSIWNILYIKIGDF